MAGQVWKKRASGHQTATTVLRGSGCTLESGVWKKSTLPEATS
jgi:hypothetical protein